MEVANGSAAKEVGRTWGKSIPVESVQELVRRDPSCVPERYVRNEDAQSHYLDRSHLSSEIPVIDLSLLRQRDESELKKLDLACQCWGFFQIINHGVAEGILRKTKAAAADFFKLPLEEKKKYAMVSNDIQGYGQLYVVSNEQKLDWSDVLALIIYPHYFRKLNCCPVEPLDFKEVVEVYSSEVNRVARELLSALSLLMGLNPEGLLELHREVLQALRFNFYPTCCKPDQVLGVSPHSDSSTKTILLQDDDVTGLQIRHNGGWLPVKPIPDALVVNVGDVIEILSNGKYKSIEHRAVTNANQPRMSLASFVSPDDDVEIEPLHHMMNEKENPRVYTRIKYGDYLRCSLKRKMEGKSHVDLVKIDY
ncbi:protein LATERAL BRANCHING OXIDOREDUCTASE 1-like [Aristolochia californica]|uniref:protein LATERAL BRANCHING OXIDOREDUCTASE 1-like n=1 Tax=Aristolochia californica TaxID=171875 RepID=UPI0035D9A316